jgi:hypothetical protein
MADKVFLYLSLLHEVGLCADDVDQEVGIAVPFQFCEGWTFVSDVVGRLPRRPPTF